MPAGRAAVRTCKPLRVFPRGPRVRHDYLAVSPRVLTVTPKIYLSVYLSILALRLDSAVGRVRAPPGVELCKGASKGVGRIGAAYGAHLYEA